MASRTSRRRQPKRARTDGARSPSVGIDNEPEDCSNDQPSSLANGKGKEVEKHFDFFQELPADLLGEVTSYLKPVDLLHLSPTTRELRAFLMGASSAVFWKRARQNDSDLPPCPPDLSEPAFVHLLFSDFCHKCLSDDRNLLLHLEARTQLCETCTLEEFRRWQELPKEVDATLSELVPDTIQQLTPKEKKQSWTKANAEYQIVGRTRFHVATAMRVHGEYKKIRGAKQRSAWLNEQKTIWAKVEEHTGKCRSYIYGEKQRERDQVWIKKRQRAARIQEKLVELGWGSEFDEKSRYPISSTPSAVKVNQLLYLEQALTDEEWEKIRDGLVDCMQEIRAASERCERFKKMRKRVELVLGPAYTAFALSQPPEAMIPTLAELALMDEFTQPLNSVPLDDDIPKGALDSTISLIPGVVRMWKASMDNSLLDLLRQSPAFADQVDLTTDVLSYASTLFTCTRCVRVLTYPGIFFHPCFSTNISSMNLESIAPNSRMVKPSGLRTGPSQEGRSGTREALVGATFGQINRVPGGAYRIWHPGPLLQFSEAAHHHTTIILGLLGLDQTTTVNTFLNINPYVEGLCRCFPRNGLK